MDKDFEQELKGSSNEAATAKQQIAKYFKRYGDSGHQDAKKHQMIFASKIMCVITRCENKHVNIYCYIITEIFANQLCPEISLKYWTLYVNCIRYFHYMLVERKDFERASLIYKHIVSYQNKLQSSENSLTCINIYCYQLFLQNSLKSKNQDLAVQDATDVVINLTKLFTEILETNKKQNFQYHDVLNKTLSWLFPQNKAGTVYHFLKILPQDNVKQMFQALFNLYGRQSFEKTVCDVESQEQAKFIIETIYMLFQVDLMDKMQLKLAVQLLSYCRIECRLQNYKPISESFILLYDYMKLLCQQHSTSDFPCTYITCCERFKDIYEKYAKVVMSQSWFGDFLVLLFYLHSQLQNTAIFNTFWKQMSKASCYKSMFQFFMDTMKLAPCILSETKLFTVNCCTSTRKHVILSFAQVALAAFVFYCQNISEEENPEGVTDLTDYYKETIQNNLLLIVNHAFKIIDKMDCITSNSQEMELILVRYKQATLSCKTSKQAGTCVAICELFLKIKTKIPNKEWPLLLRRLYKATLQQMPDEPQIGREIQMCYITSMLQENEIDICQIRTQISIFYANEPVTTAGKVNDQQSSPLQRDNCLMHLYNNSTSLFRPQLEPSRKRLLHWLESQHIVKYYKSNTSLLHSVLKCSQTHYDFVLITKLGKLQTYAMAKITSIYKSLKAKSKDLNTLTRLELLTFGHCCVMLLNDMNTNQKIQIDSKDVCEDQLENLLMREEMSTFTIQNDLKCYKLAWEGFKAFEEFYEKFDKEPINMDDAIIDWESILDDLSCLALCLQLYGYLEYSSKIWLLHYKCSRLLQDTFSALRGLAFFCEYSQHFETNETSFQLDEEIQLHFPTIMQGLDNLVNLPRQAYQNFILLAVLQIAHYYARKEKYSFAQMLLQYVEEKHHELPERQGRYDIVMGTMDAIKFRLLAKHFGDTKKATQHENNKRSTAENILLHGCLLHEIEETLDRFHEFSFISSNDGLLFSILIIGLVQELAECSVNRLCDNFINALFIATCKCTLQSGLALRFVQVMGMWMWVNLQMEYVDKAQIKLKLIEYVMGLKSLKELTDKKSKAISDIQSSTLLPNNCAELLTSSQHNPGMEAIRRLAQVQLSPIKTDKLQLSPSHRNSDLKRYLKCNIDSKLLPQNEQIEWTFFMVGCLNARLYFLVEDYDQLDMFYERGNRFLQTRRNSFNKNYYKNIQLMAMQHCANYLRARKQYDKALHCLEYAINMCENMKFYIDAVYYVNFQLQLIATKKEMTNIANPKNKQMLTHSKLRKVLDIHTSPENKQMQEQENKLQNIMASAKKPSSLMRPLPSIFTGSGCPSTKKPKTPAIIGGSSSSTSNILDNNKIAKSKPKLKFDICEDSLEIVEIIDDIVSNNKINSPEEVKPTKRTKSLEENEQLCKTPKTIKKTTKTTKSTTTTKSCVKIKRPELKPQYQIDIDLTDSPITSPYKTSTSSASSLENLETKENLNTNELVEQMQNLNIKTTKKSQKSSTKTVTMAVEEEVKIVKRRVRKPPNLVKEQAIIVLEDSPCVVKSSTTDVTDAVKSSRTRTTTRDKSPKELLDNIEDVTGKSTRTRITTKDKSPKELAEDGITLTVNETRTRRQRKLVLDTNSGCSTATTPSVTRRRQKNIV